MHDYEDTLVYGRNIFSVGVEGGSLFVHGTLRYISLSILKTLALDPRTRTHSLIGIHFQLSELFDGRQREKKEI